MEGVQVRTAGGGHSSRPLLVAPFLIGGLAGAWLASTSATLALVAIGWASSALAAAAIALLLTSAPARQRQLGRLTRAGGRADRWPARPMWSFLVRCVTVFAPIGVSMSVALAVQEALPPPEGGWSAAGQVLILLACGFGVLYPAERATRRLGPITMLLKLSLAFPSSAPSRFKVARRSGNVGRLRKTLEATYTPDDRARTETAGTLLSLLAALTAHDSRTRGHSERVRVFSEMLASELGLDERSRERLRWSALLHDIGKMAVSADVLNKPGPLDDNQWSAMRRHPSVGAELVAPLIPWLGEWGSAVVEHHERLDGSGYPRGLEREQISKGARIIAVADAFDTMVTPRSYRGAMSPAAAREEVARFSARQFDPRVVRALMNLSIPRLWWRIGLAAWLAQLPLLRRTGSDRPRSTRNPLPVAGMLSLMAVVVALSASGLLGSQGPGTIGLGRGSGSALDSSASGTVIVEEASGPARPSSPSQDPGVGGNAGGADEPAPEGDAAPVDTPPGSGTTGGGNGGGSGGGNGGGSGGGNGGATVGTGGGGGTVGTGGGGDGTVGVAGGGGGTSSEANSDATVGGTGGDGTVGGSGGQPPPVTPPPTEQPPPTPDPTPTPSPNGCEGNPGQGHGHAYGHCKDKGKGHGKG